MYCGDRNLPSKRNFSAWRHVKQNQAQQPPYGTRARCSRHDSLEEQDGRSYPPRPRLIQQEKEGGSEGADPIATEDTTDRHY